MRLADFPRIGLAHLPTPLEPLARLSEALGGPNIWVKRDDCTGLGGGGNQTRKLEFLMAAARQQGANTVITPGAVQSNHARQTAAAAARLGMGCHLLLESIAADTDRDYRGNGNVLLDRMFNAHLHHFAHGTDLDVAAESVADELRETGSVPYLIPLGGSNALGALGYAECAFELVEQAKKQDLSIDHLILATGSAGTQAGLLAGLHVQESDISVLGICVSCSAEEQEQKVGKLCAQTLELLECKRALPRELVRANGDHVGQGYGLPTRDMIKAVAQTASVEGLLLDPVYTGKAMAGLMALVRDGQFQDDDNIVFLHTGGSPALFAYRSTFDSL